MKGFYAYLKKELWEQVATFKVADSCSFDFFC